MLTQLKLIIVGIGTNLNCAWAKKQSLNADTTKADHHKDRDQLELWVGKEAGTEY